MLIRSGLFCKTNKGLMNAKLQEKDDCINVFAQYCVYIVIFADVSDTKKIKWRLFVNGGHEACYDELYDHIRSARTYLRKFQQHKNNSISKGQITTKDCYLNNKGAMDLALSNLWLKFGPNWLDYCFVLLCSWEDNYSLIDLRRSVIQWQQTLTAKLGMDVVLNNPAFSTSVDC